MHQIGVIEEKPIPQVNLDEEQYLLDALMVVGPSNPGLMGGELPISWSDVWYYGKSTQDISKPWEFQALIRMSQRYMRGKITGVDPLSYSPLEMQISGDL